MSVQETAGIQRVAVKMMCAADLLHNISDKLTKDLEASERKVTRYICQAKLLLSWKKGNAAVRIVGTTVKTVGVVAAVASSLNPRFRLAVGFGEKLWKLGTGLKILSYVASIMKEMWQKGCRESLLDFMRHTSLLVRNVGVLDELVNDVRRSVDGMRDRHQMDTAEQIWNVVSGFIPDTQSVYIRHIICLIVSSQNYSPLFDFAALITDPANDSNVLQLMQEIESIHFLEFLKENDSKTLIAVGSLLHVTRELVEFLDNFTKLRDNDCVFLQQCLARFAEESKNIRSVVLFLKNLNTIKTEFQSLNLTSEDRFTDNLSIEDCTTGTSKESMNLGTSGDKIHITFCDSDNEDEDMCSTECEDGTVDDTHDSDVFSDGFSNENITLSCA